jgi:hypothetical protein
MVIIMSESRDQSPQEKLAKVINDADAFFTVAETSIDDSISYGASETDAFWDQLTDELRDIGSGIIHEIINLASELALAIRSSPFLGEEDERQAGIALKTMRAAVRLRRYRFRDSEVLHDEGTYIGTRRAEQDDSEPNPPTHARRQFNDGAEKLRPIVEFSIDGKNSNQLPVGRSSSSTGYRPGTAFIMMWISNAIPELVDVAETIKRCCNKFGITALRADDIEHSDVITAKIVEEIRMSEFLIADLSGERPSVYYEIGFAHAIDKRVILYRKAGTPIHFDLAAYNCPEYSNMKELETLLTKRLTALTGREPSKP